MISFDDEEGLDDGGIFVEMKNDAFPAREIVFWHTPFTDTTGWHSMTLSWKQGEDTVIVVDGSVSTVANVRDLVDFTSNGQHAIGAQPAGPPPLSGFYGQMRNVVVSDTYITLEELLVIESGTTDVAEGGNTDSFNISLGYEPNYDVTVSLADTAATNQVTLSDYTLVFTDSSGATPWNEAQTVTVTAVDDAILEDEIHTTTLSIDTTSSDAAFNGLSDSVVVNITDDEGITGIYVDANDTNTDANDGTALWFVTPPVVDDGLWGRRTDEPDVQEEGDFYETSNSEDVLLLKTTLSGLHPCHPYDIRIITVADTTASWSINAGFDPCSLASYSWDSPTARLTGKYDSGNLAQFEALIGRGMTDYNGVLVVYIDSSGTDTWYDGLSYEVGGIVIETVTVGDIENAGESSGGGSLGESRICGAVDYVYEIGKFEITAGQYAAFLNAVAATDTYGLYYAGMDTTFGCKIEQPSGAQDLTTTEDGSYILNGAVTSEALTAVIRRSDATWAIPTEDEWYKAAYYNPATASYWNFATSSNNTPSNGKDYPWDTVGKLTPPFEDPGNSVCYLDGDNDLTYDSSAGEDWHMTEVGTFTNSASPYGTFDQSGNVWNWNESIISGQARSIRGGSWRSYYSPLRAANRLSNMEPGNSSDSSGFRLSLVVPGPPPGSPEIRIETSSLDFDCTDSGGGEAQAMMTMEATTADELLVNMSLDSSYTKDEIEQVAGITPQFKLTDAERIESQFAAGQETVKVIVNLVKPRQLKAMAQFKTRSKLSGKQRKQAMLQRQQEIADLQDAVIDSVKANITMKTNGKGKAKGKFKLGHRFKNISGFSAEVTYEDLETLKNDPFVRSIEPVFELTAHLQQGLPLMNALATRPLYNGMGLSIAICDTGIDSTHPRLDGGKVIGGYDFGDSDGDPSPNGQAHGTCCAGIAAGDLGTVGDYIGGIANGAKLYDLKISHGTGGSAETAAMVAAWDWCITHQYDDPANPIMVVSTSFGGGSHSGICDGEVESMTDAAAGLNAAGITVLASSGNDGYTAAIGWPACISNVVSVGAVYDAAGSYSFSLCDDPDAEADRVTCYSNSADILDILAPSNNAYTTDIVGSDGYSSGDYSATFGGTSAACPYAAGAVAALQSAAKETTGSYLSPEEVLSRLNLSGVPIADVKVPSIIKPRVDLGEAIASLDDSFETFEIYNDGQRILDVNAINKPDWVTLLPQPPYSVNPNDKVSVLAVVDCDNCGGGNLSGQLKIYSSDSDKSPYPDAVYVYKKCCQWRGSLDNTCDVDFTDFAMFASKWLDDTCLPFTWCSGADFDRSGEVDMTDLNQLAENWLK